MTREEALALLKEYNREPFHLQHAFTVEAVMRWFAEEEGFGAEADILFAFKCNTCPVVPQLNNGVLTCK